MFYIATLNPGGAERITVTIMRQLDPNLFDIYLVLVSEEGPFLKEVPNHVHIINLNKRKTLFSIFALRKVLKELKPYIVYSTLFRTHIAMDIALTGLREEIKSIYYSPTSPKLLFQRGEVGKVMRYFISRAYRNANSILAQTPEMKEEISEYHHIDRSKITVFLNPVDTEMIDEKIKNSINPFDGRRINIVAAGRLSTVKGFDVLIDAFEKVLKVNDRFHLNIIGRDAGEQTHLEKQVKDLSIEKEVTFWGYQDNPFKFFFFSDLFILSSRREGLPNVVLENIYLKKPIIATRCIPYMETLIKDTQSGFLVDIEDSEGLAQSILNYEQLDAEKFNYMDEITNVNGFFSKDQ